MSLLKRSSFQSLSAKQWLWLWVAYWRLWVVLIKIKFKQHSWLRDRISPAKAIFAYVPFDEGQLYLDMHESVRLASRLHFLPATCLPRSIVLADMLKARGHAARVLLGVSKQGDSINSHAWVEVDGVVIAEPEGVDQKFTKLL